MAGEDEDITIDLKLRDYLAASAEAAAKAMDELADNTKQAARALLLLDKRADKAAHSLEKLTLATRAASAAQKDHITNLDTVNKKMDTSIQTHKSLAKGLLNTNKRTDEAAQKTKTLSKAFGVLLRVLKPLGMGLALLAKGLALIGAASTLGPVVQNLLAVTSALGTLASFAAVIPVALGGLIATAVVAKMAFSGLGDAIKAAAGGNTAALQKLFSKLGPDAKAMGKEIGNALKLWKGMTQVVQGQFLSALTKDVPGAIRNLIPVFRDGARSIANQLGLLVDNLAAFFSSGNGKRLFGHFFEAGTQILGVFTKAIRPLLTAISMLVDAAMPAWNRLIGAFGDGLGKFSGWIANIASDGSLTEWLDTAFGVAKNLWGVLKDVGSIIKSILDAAGGAGAGASALGLFGAALHDIATWAKSIQGQDALASFFQSVGQIAKAVMPIITIIANTIGTVLAPALADIITNLAPGVTSVLGVFADVLKTLAPYMAPLAKAFSDILMALMPLAPVLVQIANVLGSALVAVLPILTPLITILATVLGQVLGPILQETADAFVQLQPAFQALIDGFTANLPQITSLIQQFGSILTESFMQHISDIIALLPALIPQLVALGTVFGQYLLTVLQQLAPLMPQIVTVMYQMSTIFLMVAPILLNVATGFFTILAALVRLNGPIISLIGKVLTFGAGFLSVINTVIAGFHAFVDGVQAGANTVIGWIQRVVGVAKSLGNPFTVAAGVIRSAFGGISGIIRGVAGAIGNVIDKASSLSHLDLNPFRFAGGDVTGGQKYTVGEIGPEMWVGKNGQTQMIGESGMDPNWKAPGSGFIVPSFMLDAFKAVERKLDVPNEPAATGGISAREIAALMDSAGGASESHHYHIPVTIMGDVSKEVDIERAVGKAIDKIERDRQERK